MYGLCQTIESNRKFLSMLPRSASHRSHMACSTPAVLRECSRLQHKKSEQQPLRATANDLQCTDRFFVQLHPTLKDPTVTLSSYKGYKKLVIFFSYIGDDRNISVIGKICWSLESRYVRVHLYIHLGFKF